MELTELSEEKQQFLTLCSNEDWEKGLYDNIRVLDNQEGHGISLSNTITFTPELIVGLEAIADIAVSHDGILFMLDKTANVFVIYPEDKQIKAFATLGDRIPGFNNSLSEHTILSIAVYRDTIFVCDSDTGTFIALSYEDSSIINIVDRENMTFDDPDLMDSFMPSGIAVDNNNNLYAVISEEETRKTTVVKIDLSHKTVKEVFHYVIAEQIQKSRYNITIDNTYITKSSKSQNRIPLFVTENRIYILVQNPDICVCSQFIISENRQKNYSFKKSEELFRDASGLCVDSQGTIYVGDSDYVGDPDGMGSIYKFSSNLGYTGKVTDYKGASLKLAIDKYNNIYIFSEDTQHITQYITQLKALENTQVPDEITLPYGEYFSYSFDSGSEDTVWHRIVIDAFIPDEANINISYVISDNKDFGNINKLISDKNSVKDNIIELNSNENINWNKLLPNPTNALIESAGRYIWLKIELITRSTALPVLKTIQLYYPSISYLRYLPAVYSKDKQSRDFLVRFLSLFEKFFSEMENRIDHIERYFDINIVDEEFCKWLSTWVAIPNSLQWPHDLLKELIKKAPELYKFGGTVKGLKEIIKLYLGSNPFIIEYFQTYEFTTQKEILQKHMEFDPYTFAVLIAPSDNGKKQDPFGEKRKKDIFEVKKLLEMTKPAYTKYKLIDLQPRIHLNILSYLGINSYIDKPSFVLNIGSNMPEDTVFSKSVTPGYMGIIYGSKLGIDSFMIDFQEE